MRSAPTRDVRAAVPPGEPIRLLMISNEAVPGGEAGLRDAYEGMAADGRIASFDVFAPAVEAARAGQAAALSALRGAAVTLRPNVVLVLTPNGMGHDTSWVRSFLDENGGPVVIYWEGDAWHRRAKPPSTSMVAWLRAADVVFAVGRRPMSDLLREKGASDVRYIPHTYCHIEFAGAEDMHGYSPTEIRFDAVLIGTRLAHMGLVSRMPGAVGRAWLPRLLTRRHGLRVAMYGSGWRGDAAHGPISKAQQIPAIRASRVSVNWDHFPRYEGLFSDRLPAALLAGRPHVTTAHPSMGWLPGPEVGLFLERSVAAVARRASELVARPDEELAALGAAAHQWVRRRLSDREAAAFMLAAVDHRFLDLVPPDPWLSFAAEWPA